MEPTGARWPFRRSRSRTRPSPGFRIDREAVRPWIHHDGIGNVTVTGAVTYICYIIVPGTSYYRHPEWRLTTFGALKVRGLRKVDDGLHKCPDTVWLSARKDSRHQRAIPLWQRGVTLDKSRNPRYRCLGCATPAVPAPLWPVAAAPPWLTAPPFQ